MKKRVLKKKYRGWDAMAYPVSSGLLRLFIVASVPALWISAVVITHRQRAVAIPLAVAGLLVLIFMALGVYGIIMAVRVGKDG